MTAERIRGLFVDMDGTIADSMPLMEMVYYRFLETHGSRGTRREFDELVGKPLEEVEGLLRSRHGLNMTRQELLTSYYEMIHQTYVEAVRPMPGAPELLRAAHGRGVFTAVVTSAHSSVAGGFLARNGLDGLISAVIGADQVSRGKPHPEPYASAAALCGCRPADCIAVEDSPVGASSAAAAGVRTIVLAPDGPADGFPRGVSFVSSLWQIIDLLG